MLTGGYSKLPVLFAYWGAGASMQSLLSICIYIYIITTIFVVLFCLCLFVLSLSLPLVVGRLKGSSILHSLTFKPPPRKEPAVHQPFSSRPRWSQKYVPCTERGTGRNKFFKRLLGKKFPWSVRTGSTVIQRKHVYIAMGIGGLRHSPIKSKI